MLSRVFPISLAALLCLTVCSCSSDRTDGARSVEDSLAEMEKTRKSLESTTAAAPVESQAPETSAPLEISKKSGDPVKRDDSVPASELDGIPETFKVKFESSSGDFVVLVHRDWAPRGAKRFHELVSSGFYDDCRYFRVLPGFMVQFGMNGDPAVQRQWEAKIQDDPVKQSNKRSYVTFATSGPDSRTTQIFISYGNNDFLDAQGFSPFGEVIEGMHNVEGIYSGHKEEPQQGRIESSGNRYLMASFPNLDYVKKATIIE